MKIYRAQELSTNIRVHLWTEEFRQTHVIFILEGNNITSSTNPLGIYSKNLGSDILIPFSAGGDDVCNRGFAARSLHGSASNC